MLSLLSFLLALHVQCLTVKILDLATNVVFEYFLIHSYTFILKVTDYFLSKGSSLFGNKSHFS